MQEAGKSEQPQPHARAATLAKSSTGTTAATSELAGPRAAGDDLRRRRLDRLLANAPKPTKGARYNIPRATDLDFGKRLTVKWHRAKASKATTGTATSDTRAKPPAAKRSATAKRLASAPHQKVQSIKVFFQRQQGDAKRTRDDATPHTTARCEPWSARSPGQSVGATSHCNGQSASAIDSVAKEASGQT